jgi:hypothetical protein
MTAKRLLAALVTDIRGESQLDNVLRNNAGQMPTLALPGTSATNIAIAKGTATPRGQCHRR